jgi:hypothetical protein
MFNVVVRKFSYLFIMYVMTKNKYIIALHLLFHFNQNKIQNFPRKYVYSKKYQ